MAFVITEYETVIAELKRRDLLETIQKEDHFSHAEYPNRAIGSLVDRELFYVQDDPRLAAWAKYDTDEQWHEAFANVTYRRILS